MDAPSLGDDSEHPLSSATGCGAGHAQQALTEALDGGKVHLKPKQALHHSACCLTTSSTRQRRRMYQQFPVLVTVVTLG